MLTTGAVLDGRYRILGLLGRGGMGVVYHARDEQLGREVAIKQVEGQLSPTRRARLQREAQVTASLQHPGIVRLHAVGELRGGPYLVYELVEGARELGEVFEEETGLRRRVELIQAAAAGVGAAHGQGVVHRDVKPANILVDVAGRARVADFGLARAKGQSRLTRTGAMSGTPTHMAPEQLDPSLEVGPPADVWALGVVLYQALTDALPFSGETWQLLMVQVTDHEPESPSQLRPGIPLDLSAVCLQALAKAPQDRYPHAGALADDLARWLAGEPVQARPHRRRGPLWLLALSAALLVGALLAVALPRAAPPSPRSSPSTSVVLSPSTPAVAEPSTSPDPGQQLRAIAALNAGPGQTLAAVDWLSEHREHPAADRARELIGEAWDRPVLTFTHPDTLLLSLLWLGPRLLATSGNHTLRIWRLAEVPELVAEHALPGPAALALAPRAGWLLACSGRSLVRFDLSDPTRPAEPLGELELARNAESLAVQEEPQRSWLAAAGFRQTGVWDLDPAGLGPASVLVDTRDKSCSLAFCGEHGLCLGTVTSPDDASQILRVDLTLKPPQVVQHIDMVGAATCLCWTPQGLAAGYKNGALSLTNMASGTLRMLQIDGAPLMAHGGAINGMAWRDGRLFTCAKFGELGVWDLSALKTLRPHRRLNAGQQGSFDLSPGGAYAAVGAMKGGQVRIYLAGAAFW